MCDFSSAQSAILDIGQGAIEKQNAKSVGSFEAIQMEAAGMIAAADARAESTEVRKEFIEMFEANVAAMALSGMNPESFASIMKGNREDMRDSLEKLKRGSDRKQRQSMISASISRMNGKIEGRAAMLNGFVKASDKIMAAEDSYQESHTGEGRLEFALKGAGVKDETIEKWKGSRGGSFFLRK